MKTKLPIAIAFLSGLAMVAVFFLNPEKVGDMEGELLQWTTVIAGFTLLLGVVSIVRVNWRPVVRRERGWFNKAALLLAVGGRDGNSGGTSSQLVRPFSARTAVRSTIGSSINFNAPMMATMFAMLAFYVASAAFRAFRARNAEATLLLIDRDYRHALARADGRRIVCCHSPQTAEFDQHLRHGGRECRGTARHYYRRGVGRGGDLAANHARHRAHLHGENLR